MFSGLQCIDYLGKYAIQDLSEPSVAHVADANPHDLSAWISAIRRLDEIRILGHNDGRTLNCECQDFSIGRRPIPDSLDVLSFVTLRVQVPHQVGRQLRIDKETQFRQPGSRDDRPLEPRMLMTR